MVLSDEWELPFSEVIDWSKAALIVEEKNVLFVRIFHRLAICFLGHRHVMGYSERKDP